MKNSADIGWRRYTLLAHNGHARVTYAAPEGDVLLGVGRLTKRGRLRGVRLPRAARRVLLDIHRLTQPKWERKLSPFSLDPLPIFLPDEEI